MSSKFPKPRSIASRLVLLFTLSAALLLVCGLGVLYWIFVQHAYEEDNEVLADKIAGLRAELERVGDPAAMREDLKVHAGEHMAYWVRYADANSKSIVETPGMEPLLPTAVFPLPSGSGMERGSPIEYRTGKKLFSLITTRVEVAGRSYVMQVAQDRSGDEDFVKEFGALLVVVLAFGSIASAVIAMRVTKRGLRPLEEMTSSLKEFGPERLHERMPPAG